MWNNKFSYKNKFISLFLSYSLIANSAMFAAVVGTPQLNSTVNGNVNCDTPLKTEYFPLGDSRGVNVLTKKEEVRKCEVTITEQGKCLRWSEEEVDRSITPGKYDTYSSKNYSDTLGSLLAALGSYDQIEHIWSGWKGYCEIGTKSDFSWAEDPMFWASMAMSFLMQSTTPAQPDGTGGGLLTNTSVGEFVNGTGNAIGDTVQSGATSTIGGEAMSNAAAQAGTNAGTSFMDSATANGNLITDSAVDSAIAAGTETFYTNIGRCVMAAGFQVITTAYEFMADKDSGGLECDPVDEVCNTGSDVSASESEVMTMDETQFNDLVQQFATMSPPENIYDYVYVIPPSPSEGIVSYRMKQMNEFSNVAGMDQAAMDELKGKMKEMQAMISMATTVAGLAGCVAFGGSGDVGQPSTGDDRATLRAGATAAINFAAKFMGPWGPVVAAVLKIALYVATSFRSIDSCHNEDDAKELNKRHERTQKALKFDLCHLIEIKCAEESMLAGSFLQNECVLDGYHYCCYDQILSKILVEQLKAQLGRDWAHCTGISIRDLNYISFKQCSDTEMSAPGTIDGAHQVGDYDPTKAFQYKSKCIDMTEFKEYLSATAGLDIDMSDFKDFWNDLTNQYPESGTVY